MGGVRGEAKAQGRETQVFVIHGASPSDWSRSLYKSAEREKGGKWRFDWSSKDLEAKLRTCNLTNLL